MDAPRLYRRPSVLASVVRGVVLRVTLTALAALVAWPVHRPTTIERLEEQCRRLMERAAEQQRELDALRAAFAVNEARLSARLSDSSARRTAAPR